MERWGTETGAGEDGSEEVKKRRKVSACLWCSPSFMIYLSKCTNLLTEKTTKLPQVFATFICTIYFPHCAKNGTCTLKCTDG